MQQENPVLVERYRAEVLESFHRGVVCMVNEHNEVIFSVGDIDQLCFPRSALKLFQVMPLLESGAAAQFGFTMEEIAIMCGSHNGEAEHLRVVSSILDKIGVNKSELRCGKQLPTLTEDRSALIKSDKSPEDIHNNCSGKHAGFLAYCVFAGYDIHSYIDPTHPLQKIIKSVTAEMHEIPEEKMVTAMDGCSAPIFSLTVKEQAIGYRNIVNPVKFSKARQESCATIINAMTQYPYMVAGKNRYCTEMMEVCGSRIFGKTGADGVYSLGFLQEKVGCTIKIDDGLMGPQYAVAQEMIQKSGLFTEEALAPLHKYIECELKNWNKFYTGKEAVRVNSFDGFKGF